MNFLLHRHLAGHALDSPAAAHGAMLPDLWRMADRRVRARPDPLPPGDESAHEAAIEAGIAHHLEADRWFHRSAHFLDGEQLCAAGFRAAEPVAPRMGLLAHAAWELCLDGALVRRLGLPAVREAVACGFALAGDGPSRRAAGRHHFARVPREEHERAAFEERMRTIEERLLEGGWIAAYADGAGLVRVLDGIRRRLALDPLGARDRHRLAGALDALVPAADAALSALLAEAPPTQG